MLRWGNLSSMKLLMGKKILPIAEVVVSMSGSWEPRTAKPNAIGSAVPMIKDVPAAAMREWVMAMKARKILGMLLAISISLLNNLAFIDIKKGRSCRDWVCICSSEVISDSLSN